MNRHVLLPETNTLNTNITSELWEFHRLVELDDRRLYLYGEIVPVDEDTNFYSDTSASSFITEQIINYNRMDDGIEPEKRDPIRLYINSPGGDVTEGFAVVSAIELSETPVHTINIGQWSSMAFLIGISGQKRFSLPYMTFLMHEASSFSIGKISSMEDKIKFDKLFSNKAVKQLVLRHSKLTEEEYDSISTKEFYMLPEDALERGFIDQIVTNLSEIF